MCWIFHSTFWTDTCMQNLINCHDCFSAKHLHRKPVVASPKVVKFSSISSPWFDWDTRVKPMEDDDNDVMDGSGDAGPASVFQQAAQRVQMLAAGLPKEMLLYLYARYKQVGLPMHTHNFIQICVLYRQFLVLWTSSFVYTASEFYRLHLISPRTFNMFNKMKHFSTTSIPVEEHFLFLCDLTMVAGPFFT